MAGADVFSRAVGADQLGSCSGWNLGVKLELAVGHAPTAADAAGKAALSSSEAANSQQVHDTTPLIRFIWSTAIISGSMTNGPIEGLISPRN